jgi:hypothetical protein
MHPVVAVLIAIAVVLPLGLLVSRLWTTDRGAPATRFDRLPRVLARIGDQELTKDELRRPLERLDGSWPARTDDDVESFADAVEALVRGEVLRRVLLPEVRRRKLELTPDEARRMLPLGPRTRRVIDFLAEPVLGSPPFARTEEALLVDKLLRDEIAKEPIGEAELRQAYAEAPPNTLVVPASYRARRIVVPRLPTDVGPAAYVRLEALRRELSKPGADFAVAARRESIGPEAAHGGLLSEVTPGTAEPLQLDALGGLAPGEISHPQCRGFRCEILKLEHVTPARRKTFEEARPELLERLRLASARERVQRWVAAQERAAGVEIYVTGARR